MRASRIMILALALPLLSTAQAQPQRKSVEARLDELSSKVDGVQRSAADAETALKTIQELRGQLQALQQEVEQQRVINQGYLEARRQIENYEQRIGTMELQFAAMTMQAAARGEIVGYDRGFFMRSPDRRFLLKIGALLQAAYQAQIYDEGEIYASGDLGRNSSTFAMRRAALDLNGHLFSRLSFRLGLDFGTVDPGPLLEAYADLMLHRSVNLRAGRLKIPLSRQFEISSAHQQFTERSGVVASFVPGWDQGAMLHGDLSLAGILSYEVGIFNGAGSRELTDDNVDFLYAMRLRYEPLGHLGAGEGDLDRGPLRVALGAGFTYNLARTDMAERLALGEPNEVAASVDRDGDGNIDNVGIYTLGFELSARYRGIALQNELFYRIEDPGAVGDKRTFLGVYSQLGVFPFSCDTELALRYSYWEPNYYGLNRALLEPQAIHELALVLNLLTWQRMVRWQVEYAHQWQRDFQSVTMSPEMEVGTSQITMQVGVVF